MKLTTLDPALVKKPTKRHKEVMELYLVGTTPTNIAEALGISQQRVSQILSYPHVEHQLNEQMQSKLRHGSVRAMNSMIRLSSEAKSEYVQYQASSDLLDRAGYKPPDRSIHRVEGDISISIDLSGD